MSYVVSNIIVGLFFYCLGSVITWFSKPRPKKPICPLCEWTLRPVQVTPHDTDRFPSWPQGAEWYCAGENGPRHAFIYFSVIEPKPEPLTEL